VPKSTNSDVIYLISMDFSSV